MAYPGPAKPSLARSSDAKDTDQPGPGSKGGTKYKWRNLTSLARRSRRCFGFLTCEREDAKQPAHGVGPMQSARSITAVSLVDLNSCP